jgi:hypothetical protein
MESGDLMSTINTVGRPAYVYDQGTDTWYQVSGKADTASAYVWDNTHKFTSAVTFDQTIRAKGGINNFENPAARSAIITAPVVGLISFIKFDADGLQINDLQYYTGSKWTSVTDPTYDFNQQSSSYTLISTDSFKMIEMSNGGNLTIPPNSAVPFEIGTAVDVLQTGASQVTIVAGVGVTVNATPGLKLRTQWSSATLVKRNTDTWVVLGDLSA